MTQQGTVQRKKVLNKRRLTSDGADSYDTETCSLNHSSLILAVPLRDGGYLTTQNAVLRPVRSTPQDLSCAGNSPNQH